MEKGEKKEKANGLEVHKGDVLICLEGIILWDAAAMMVKHIPSLFQSTLPFVYRSLFYASLLPSSYLVIYLNKRMFNWQTRQQVTRGITIGTTTALFLDGLAHGFFPSIYSNDPTVAVRGAGAIFWGAACFIALSPFV